MPLEQKRNGLPKEAAIEAIYRPSLHMSEMSQIAVKEEGTAPYVRCPTIERRGAAPHPRSRPCGAEVPQVAAKEEGARLACGARRLNGKMRCLSPAGAF